MTLVAVLLFSATLAYAEWDSVAPGVDYQRFRRDKHDVHVTRVDLTNQEIAVFGTRESDKGTRVSDFGKKYKALAAINGDYFDERFNPIGKTTGPCGAWEGVKLSKREALLAIGDDEATLVRQTEVDPKSPAPKWADAAISGWPALIVKCAALSSAKLPGSDAFTRAPHPRTAVGLSKDRKTLYLVVADGRRADVPGMTLAQLGAFMADELDACWAMNLDGGGSSAMWVRDRIISRPSDGTERPVANHLGVALRSDLVACDVKEEAEKLAALREREAKKQEQMSSSTTTVTTTTRTTTNTTTTTTNPPR
jgi:Phosphodiester glycosidase